MTTILELLGSSEFWMAISLVAAALPGPQTRILPALFRSLARVLPPLMSSLSKVLAARGK